jgi:AraC-like DNA-binding protein
MLEAANGAGIDGTATLNAYGLSPHDLNDPLCRLPAEVIAGLCHKLGAQLDLPAFHLHVAETAPAGSFDLAEMLLRAAPDVRAQLDTVARFARVFFDYPLKISAYADEVELTVSYREPSAALVVESFFARLLVVLRQTTGVRVRPSEVRFQTGAPRHEEQLSKLFDAPLRFHHLASELVLDAALLDRPTRTGDPHLRRTLERVAGELCERLPAIEQLSQRVRQMIRQTLPDQDPSVHRIASKLGMSTRTLQRKLGDESTTYQRVLDGVRLELSIEYLAMSRMPLADAATLLGFADLTSFHRAFKRWTGTPPAEFRKQLRGAKPGGDGSA